ncbi:MAG: radical SAM protein [Chloroflexota bacterium]|nr:radical SAM protein [Chloroflexota bacterium]
MFKTLVSNHCVNNCRYCPIRANSDPRRCTLEPEETVRTFLEYLRRGRVQGIFLTSGVTGTPDRTMDRINAIASILRKDGFRGYMHLKIIPGASDAAIEEAVSLASAVSVNIETAGENNFAKISPSKDYARDVLQSIGLVSRLTSESSQYHRVKQTTQFIVGAAEETDQDIVGYSWSLYKDLKLSRVYFSAYQRGLGEPDLPGELSLRTNAELLTREHRLYQTDWLLRKYGFTANEISFEQDGNLSLSTDPKEVWASMHPEFFPVDVNKADRHDLLRVPGFGPVTVNTILRLRKEGRRIRSIETLGKPGKRLAKANDYIWFGG